MSAPPPAPSGRPQTLAAGGQVRTYARASPPGIHTTRGAPPKRRSTRALGGPHSAGGIRAPSAARRPEGSGAGSEARSRWAEQLGDGCPRGSRLLRLRLQPARGAAAKCAVVLLIFIIALIIVLPQPEIGAASCAQASQSTRQRASQPTNRGAELPFARLAPSKAATTTTPYPTTTTTTTTNTPTIDRVAISTTKASQSAVGLEVRDLATFAADSGCKPQVAHKISTRGGSERTALGGGGGGGDLNGRHRRAERTISGGEQRASTCKSQIVIQAASKRSLQVGVARGRDSQPARPIRRAYRRNYYELGYYPPTRPKPGEREVELGETKQLSWAPKQTPTTTSYSSEYHGSERRDNNDSNNSSNKTNRDFITDRPDSRGLSSDSSSHQPPQVAPRTAARSARSAGDKIQDDQQQQQQDIDEQLIELIAQFYAHTLEVRDKFESLSGVLKQLQGPQSSHKVHQPGGGTSQPARQVKPSGDLSPARESSVTPTAGNTFAASELSELERLKMLVGADDNSLVQWLRQQQNKTASLAKLAIEIREFANRSMVVCSDGPKILVKPDASRFVKCYTEHQWIEKLWADLSPSTFHYPIIVFNLLIFLIGTTGNVFVCLSVLILICLPATAVWDLYLTWFFGTIPCKLIMFLQDVSISVSVLTLTAISIDRYYAICHPLKFKSSLNQAKRMIALIWIVSLLTMTPDLVYLDAITSEDLLQSGIETVLYSDCNYQWSEQSSKLFQFVKTILLYLLPFVLMFCAHYKILQALRLASTMALDETNSPLQDDGQPASSKKLAASQLGIKSAFGHSYGVTSSSSSTSAGGGKQQRVKFKIGKTFLSHKVRSARCRHESATNSELSPEPAHRSNGAPLIAINSAGVHGDVSGKVNDSGTRASDREGAQTSGSCPAKASPTATQSRQVRFAEPSLVGSPASCDRLILEESNSCSSIGRFVSTTTTTTNSSSSAANLSQETMSSRLSELEADTDKSEELAKVSAVASKTNGKLSVDAESIISTNYLHRDGSFTGSQNQLILTMHNKSRLESRQRAAKMLSAIVVIFGICYLPVHLINFLRQFIDNIPQNDVTSTISMLSHSVCYLNSAINPIIYNHMNSVFRQEFRRFLSCCPRFRSALHSGPQCKGAGQAHNGGLACQTGRCESATTGGATCVCTTELSRVSLRKQVEFGAPGVALNNGLLAGSPGAGANCGSKCANAQHFHLSSQQPAARSSYPSSQTLLELELQRPEARLNHKSLAARNHRSFHGFQAGNCLAPALAIAIAADDQRGQMVVTNCNYVARADQPATAAPLKVYAGQQQDEGTRETGGVAS